jgi:hypothetical protein
MQAVKTPGLAKRPHGEQNEVDFDLRGTRPPPQDPARWGGDRVLRAVALTDNRGWLYFRTSPKEARGHWVIPSSRSGAAVSGWVVHNHHLNGLVESILMNVGGYWWNGKESET